MLAHVNTVFEAEQIGHLPLRTLAETHDHLLCWRIRKKINITLSILQIYLSIYLTALSILNCQLFFAPPLSLHMSNAWSKQENGCNVIRKVINKLLLSPDSKTIRNVYQHITPCIYITIIACQHHTATVDCHIDMLLDHCYSNYSTATVLLTLVNESQPWQKTNAIWLAN